MGLGHKRSDLRANAQAKLDDAMTLFDNGRFSNAYYLAGYAVEIGLKACIAAQVVPETIPDKKLLEGFFQHGFTKLITLAGLTAQLSEQGDMDADFAANWAIVAEWTTAVRYESKDVTSAQTIITAVADPKSGVLQWIKTYW